MNQRKRRFRAGEPVVFNYGKRFFIGKIEKSFAKLGNPTYHIRAEDLRVYTILEMDGEENHIDRSLTKKYFVKQYENVNLGD